MKRKTMRRARAKRLRAQRRRACTCCCDLCGLTPEISIAIDAAAFRRGLDEITQRMLLPARLMQPEYGESNISHAMGVLAAFVDRFGR